MNLFQAILDFLHKLFFANQETVIEVEDEGEIENYEEENEQEVEGIETVEEIEHPDDVVAVPCGSTKKIKILVDNGHGYDTAGKRSPYSAHNVLPAIEFYEYQWNREIANEIVNQLIEKGYDAKLLVTEENDISLKERVRRANTYCSDLGASNVILLSIHANAAGMGDKWMNARGWCSYTTRGETKSDKIAEYLYDEAEKNFKGMKIRKDMTDGDRDWEADFYIIKNSKCPAVLTENFFYDNVDDVKYILSDEGKKAVIKTHVDGLINYIKSL